MRKTKLGPLADLLTKHAAEKTVEGFAVSVEALYNPNSPTLEIEVGTDLEIVFRTRMAKLLSLPSPTLSPQIHDLVNFALSCGLSPKVSQKLGANSKRIPFLLLEDILEAQTVLNAEAVWGSVIESREMTERLTHPDLFTRGSNILLRMCNSLLRRISRSCHTELCGRVLMFLAAIFPISERSAVNLTGKIRPTETSFENASVYADKRRVERTGRAHLDGDGDHEQQSEEERSVAAGGGAVAAAAAGEDLYNDIDNGQVSTGVGGEELSYSAYQNFWELQSFFAGAAPSHEALLNKIDLVLSLFRQVEAGSDATTRAEDEKREQEAKLVASKTLYVGEDLSSSSSTSTSSDDPRAYLGCKFLTSSELFALQLRDPLLRQQVCAQVLFLTHSIRRISNLSAAMLKLIKHTEGRALTLIRNTPRGSHLEQVLLKILYRESFWAKWKVDGCPPFERAAVVGAGVAAHASSSSPASASAPASKGGAKKKVTPSASYDFGKTFEEALDSARALVASVPTFEQHIERYMDAEDPDAGIDAEYHPKREDDYCWRARRLLAARHLSAFEAMADGDIGNGLVRIKEGSSSSSSSSSSVLDLVVLADEVEVDEQVAEEKLKLAQEKAQASAEVRMDTEKQEGEANAEAEREGQEASTAGNEEKQQEGEVEQPQQEQGKEEEEGEGEEDTEGPPKKQTRH
jgi:THO complex subunit 1